MVCLNRTYCFKCFKGYISQILFGPFWFINEGNKKKKRAKFLNLLKNKLCQKGVGQDNADYTFFILRLICLLVSSFSLSNRTLRMEDLKTSVKTIKFSAILS